MWVGHLSKLVHQEELSDTFGKYGDIVSIDMIHPRGCAFIVMNRRQDAYKAMQGLNNHKMQMRAITISWAAGKGVKSKEWKDFWELDLGVSYVPWLKLDNNTDFESLEEGGMFDEDSMPTWLKEKIKTSNQKKDQLLMPSAPMYSGQLDTTQPPPNPQMMQNVSMVNPFGMGPVPRLMGPLGMHMPPNMVSGMPLGVPPPQMMMPPQGMVPGLPPMPLDKSVPPPSGGSGPGGFMSHFPPIPMPPQMQHIAVPPVPQISNSNDDHMDIEMEDETSAKMPNPPMLGGHMGIFNRPPPQMFPGGQSMPGMPPVPPGMPLSFPKERDDSRERRRDRSDSRDRRSRERDFRSDDRDRGRERDRESRNRDRGMDDRRGNDFNRDRNSNNNSRWTDRGRSRDDEIGIRDRRNSRDRGDRVSSRDRGDKPPLPDRLRDISSDVEFGGRRENNDMVNNWRDVPPSSQPGPHGGNFAGNNFMGIRPLMMPLGGAPPLMDNSRGPPGGMPGPNFRGGNDFGNSFNTYLYI